jgi:hypothetical protein
VPATDGTWRYAWDVHALPDDIYFLRATVHDATAGTASSDSSYGLGLYHIDGGVPPDELCVPPDLVPAPPDLVTPPMPPMATGGCNCAVAPSERAFAGSSFFAMFGFFGAFVMIAGFARFANRRRGSRRGSRSGCTG